MVNPYIETYNYYQDSRVQSSMFRSVWEIIHQESNESIVSFDKEWLEGIVFGKSIEPHADEWIENSHECVKHYRNLISDVERKESAYRMAKSGSSREEASERYDELRCAELDLRAERSRLYDLALEDGALSSAIGELGFFLYDDGGEPHEYCLRLPIEFEVCGECRGSGKVVNPSIDCCGLTLDDFENDYEFEDDYFSGRHDIICAKCRGIRVEANPLFPEWIKAEIISHNDDQWDMIHEQCAELSRGA